MKDFSREERELEQRISKMAKEYGENKWSRIKRTFLVLSGGIYLLSIYNGLKNDLIDIEYLLSWLGIAPVMAGFLFLISLGVLYHILDNTVKERIIIAKLEGKLLGMKYATVLLSDKDEI